MSSWILAPFKLEAVEANLCYFFENWLMKLKCPNLLKPLGTIIQQNYWSFYPSEPFSFVHFNMIHPVPSLFFTDKCNTLLQAFVCILWNWKRSTFKSTFLCGVSFCEAKCAKQFLRWSFQIKFRFVPFIFRKVGMEIMIPYRP